MKIHISHFTQFTKQFRDKITVNNTVYKSLCKQYTNGALVQYCLIKNLPK
jgi:hypothetical protein